MSEVDALEKMDDELWQSVSAGLSASAAVILLNHQYYGVTDNQGLFKTNISNTLVYKTLESITKQSVVCAYDTLESYRNINPRGWFDIRGFASLRHHREQASNSESIQWKDPAMREFFSKEMCYLRATRMFQARQSVLDRLAELGQSPSQNRPRNEILPSVGVVRMIRSAMESVVQDGITLNASFDQLITLSFQVVDKSIFDKAQL